jgi:glycosyltransferase involved in cell wall biosynthesis
VSEPLVSILIPTYNGERFLRPALRSALEQSYRNIEVLVGDDASTDGTARILAAAEASDPRVRVIRYETNAGAFDNPVRLFDEAKGEYVKFLLHDDVLATDCVRDLLRGLESTPGATLAFSKRVLIDENGKTREGGDLKPLAERAGPMDGHQLAGAILESCANVIGELTTILFRRADVDRAWMWQIDGRRLDVLGDLSLCLRLLAKGPAFYSPRALSRFRQHATQTSQDPRLIARGVRDWPRLIDWGVRQGFLPEPDRQRRAYGRALQAAAVRVAQLATDSESGAALEAVYLSTARLLELGGGLPADMTQPLQRRAHRRPVLDRLTQELDVWLGDYPFALAAPALSAEEVGATVQALREVLATGAAKQALVAVAPPLVDDAVPLIEAALADGPDIAVELVPTDDPARLLDGPWLAVASPGASWFDGRAAGVWAVGTSGDQTT